MKDLKNRKRCFKYFAVAVAVQTVGALILGLLVTIAPTLSSVLVAGFYVYTPTIFLVWILGAFKGESALIWPMVLGIPLGILLYSFILASALDYLRRRRDQATNPDGGP